jgi:hypothetical protein
MIGDRIWKEAVTVQLRYYCGIFVKRLRKRMETLNRIAGIPVN